MSVIHPVIRIVSFGVLTASLSMGRALDIAIAIAILGILYWQVHAQAWPATWRLLRKMRWLFLSIAIIYLWMTPGQSLLPEAGRFAAWVPTLEGLTQGIQRVLALILMVAAASLLLQSTPRDQILAAIRWLLAPLGVLGFPHERFAVRVALTLEAVTQVQSQVKNALSEVPANTSTMSRIGAVTAVVFRATLQEAEAAPCIPMVIDQPAPPALIQWGLPMALFIIMTAAGQLSY